MVDVSALTEQILGGSEYTPSEGITGFHTLPSAARAALGKQAYRLTPATLASKMSGGLWHPAPHLQYISTRVAARWKHGKKRLIVSMPVRHGKALKHGTLVKVPSGYTPIERLQVGDLVTTPNGDVPVLGAYPQGEVQLYKMTLSGGCEVECCEDHVWHVRELNTSNRNFTTKELMAEPLKAAHNRFHIPCLPSDGQDGCDELKPELMRAITGLEASTKGQATCISIDSKDGLFFVTKDNIVTHNSELLSVYTPCWVLDRDPGSRVIQCSYGAELANEFSQRVRDLILEQEAEDYGELRVRIRPDNKKVDRFKTTKGVGGLVSSGVGGAITGRGANLLSIDDYMKNAKESMSETIREDHWNWFLSTAYTRMEPNGNIIIIATRWNIDDLIGRLLEEQGDQWEHIKLKALAEDDDPLGRQPGEALWPERFSREDLELIKANLGTYWWQSLYQQDPLPSMSGLFQDSWLRYPEQTLPNDRRRIRFVRHWDLASIQGGGDYTVGALLAWWPELRLTYIVDIARGQWAPSTVEAKVKACAESDGPDVDIGLEEEPGSAGKLLVDHYKRNVLPHRRVHATKSTGPKTVRATPFLAAAEDTRIRMVPAAWNVTVKKEFRMFPNGEHDDVVDAISGGYNWLHPTGGHAGVWGRDRRKGFIEEPPRAAVPRKLRENRKAADKRSIMGATWGRR